MFLQFFGKTARYYSPENCCNALPKLRVTAALNTVPMFCLRLHLHYYGLEYRCSALVELYVNMDLSTAAIFWCNGILE
jgi:hypothetical protein